jgi:hypothetical protein
MHVPRCGPSAKAPNSPVLSSQVGDIISGELGLGREALVDAREEDTDYSG